MIDAEPRLVRLWVWTDKGPRSRRIPQDELDLANAILAVEDATGWWVTECGQDRHPGSYTPPQQPG